MDSIDTIIWMRFQIQTRYLISYIPVSPSCGLRDPSRLCRRVLVQIINILVVGREHHAAAVGHKAHVPVAGVISLRYEHFDALLSVIGIHDARWAAGTMDRMRLGTYSISPSMNSQSRWCCIALLDFSPTASLISFIVGEYPFASQKAEMNDRMLMRVWLDMGSRVR